METSKIKVVFFDIGGVMLGNGWGHLSREEAAKKFNLNYEEKKVLHTFIFKVFEFRSISLDDYLDTIVFNHPRDLSKKVIRNCMLAESVGLPDMLPWLKKWKKNPGSEFFLLLTKASNSVITALKCFRCTNILRIFFILSCR